MKVAAQGFLAFLIAILVLEAGARVAATISDNVAEFAPGPATVEQLPGYVASAELGWMPQPNFSGNTRFGIFRQFDSRGFFMVDSAQVDDRSKKRIVFLGDSNTFGYGVEPSSTFVEVLDLRLPRFSTINLAAEGYSSFQGYKTLLKFGETIDPDILVVSFNFNDRRFVRDETAVDSDESFREIADAISLHQTIEVMRISYLYRAVKFALQRAKVVPDDSEPARRTGKVRVADLIPRVAPENYRENLTKIARWAMQRDVPLIFMLLGDNPIQTTHLRRGIRRIADGKFRSAIDDLKVAMRFGNFEALARRYLVEAYENLGLATEADEVGRMAVYIQRDGGQSIYLDDDYHRIMRDVAAEYGAALIDARAVLDLNPGDYIDFCHFDETGHSRVANLLYETLRTMIPEQELTKP